MKKLIKGIDTCNVTSCQTTKNVHMWNRTIDAFYCEECAKKINEACEGETWCPLCIFDINKKEYNESGTQLSWKSWQQGGIK